MLQETMTTKKKTPHALPRNRQQPNIDFHPLILRIPMDLWKQMLVHGLSYGRVTTFILQAIREKLDREAQK